MGKIVFHVCDIEIPAPSSVKNFSSLEKGIVDNRLPVVLVI